MNEESRVLRHETTIRRAVWPPLLAMALLAALLVFLVYQLLDTAHWVQHSDAVLSQANRTFRLAEEMQSDRRAFFLGYDPAFIERTDKASEQIDKEFALLDDLVSDKPEQEERAKAMRAAFEEWRTYADRRLAAFRKAPSPVFSKVSANSRGNLLMGKVRDEFEALTLHENQLRQLREARAEDAVRIAMVGGGLVTLFVGGVLALTTRRQMRSLSHQYESVLDAEQRVRERLATTLTSIGDGVIVTDARGKITLLNPITEAMTGWTQDEARGQDSSVVFDISHEETGEAMVSPVERAIRENGIVQLANHTLLKRRDGSQIAIEDSAAPVRDRAGHVTGVVLVFRDVSERKQREAEVASLLERNTRIAETLQRSMLLTPPQEAFPGLQLSTHYEPASDEAQVGGDFYDAFAFSENRVALVVGDSTGKGLRAAAITSEVKFVLRAFLHETEHPAEAMMRLNRYLVETWKETGEDVETSAPSSLISMAVAVIDTATGEGRCVLAGAEPLVLLSRSGTTQVTGEPGPLLGAARETIYEETPFFLKQGDLLAFTTDGITEARRGRREFFGFEGVTQALQTARQTTAAPLSTVTESVVVAAKTFAGGRLKDDACLLLVERIP